MLFVTLLFAASLCLGSKIEGDCTKSDAGLKWLASVLSDSATISCRGQPGQLYNANRYWGLQYGKNSSVVVYPRNTNDVSYAVQATQKTPLGRDYAFVSGGHSMTNSSTSEGFIIDLMYLNKTEVLYNYPSVKDGRTTNVTAIAYGGGTTTVQFQRQLNGTGFTGVSARVAEVGMGGFSTGGGIGYIAGAYGYASDRLIALEVVLPSGKIVYADAGNKYSDLLWAFKGAGLGQFGIVTTFFQLAAPTPKTVGLSFHILSSDTANIDKSFSNTVDFFNTHNDPFSLMYYAIAYLPTDIFNTNPKPSDFSLQHIIATVYFDDPVNGAQQPSYDATYKDLLSGLTTITDLQFNVGYTDLSIVLEGFFPYGLRRGFYGPQTTNISVPYLQKARQEFNTWVNGVLATGDTLASSLWALQYMSPGLNGNLPKSDADTAWPHSVAGHQTLFDPGWGKASTDSYEDGVNTAFNDITYEQQANNVAAMGINTAPKYNGQSVCGGSNLCDYPNYISPHVSGRQVWGNNIERLIRIKQKYDPLCTLHTGRVFASESCILRGVANVYP